MDKMTGNLWDSVNSIYTVLTLIKMISMVHIYIGRKCRNRHNDKDNSFERFGCEVEKIKTEFTKKEMRGLKVICYCWCFIKETWEHLKASEKFPVGEKRQRENTKERHLFII